MPAGRSLVAQVFNLRTDPTRVLSGWAGAGHELSKSLHMPPKRKPGKPPTVAECGRATRDQYTSGTSRWHYIGYRLGILASIVAILTYLTPPLRHLVLPPRLEYKVLRTEGPTVSTKESALGKSYWVAYELVDPATDSRREILRVDTPVYVLPVRFTARRANLDITSCQFTQGDRSLDHLAGIPTFLRMRGDAVAEEELDEILQALLAHDLSTARGKPHVTVSMPHIERHLQRFRGLLDRVAAIPVTLRQDDPVSFLLVCVPRLHAGGDDYLAGLDDLSARAQLDLYSRQQEALRRLSGEDFTIDLSTNYDQEIQLPAQLQRQISAVR